MKMKMPVPKQLPSGAWRCQITVDGKRASVTDEDPEMAQAKAVALRAKLIEQSKTPKDSITLKSAIEGYIAERDNVLSPSTIRGYHVVMDNRFPELMKTKVRDIDESSLQRAINKEAKSKSAKTIKNGMGLVISVVSRYKPINMKLLKYPQRVPVEHAYLDGDQIVRLITACEGDIAEIPILLGLWLGLRRSEIMGLRWESIDLENRKIRVERSMVIDKDDNIVIKDVMKTETSNRVLDCPAYIVAKLESYQPCPDLRVGPVFHIHYNTIYKNLEKICNRCGLPFVGVHGLRHTNASVMLSLGIVDKVAMARGGWSSKETMERIYQHIFSSDKQAADSAINQYFDQLIAHENAHEETEPVAPQQV